MADFGSLVTGNDPAMWDEWLKKIASQMTQEPDRKAPLSTGLMAAGLGMLANAHKGFAGAAGEGGLLGLNTWQQGLAQQKKDPMQQLQMMNAVSGIQERMRDQKMQQEFQSAIMGGQPQQMAPQYGMQDRSMGEMPQAAPMASGNGPALAVLEKYLANPKLATAAEKLIKHYYPDTKMGPGDVLYRGDQKMVENVDPLKPVKGPDGVTRYPTGLLEDQARGEELKANATEAAKLRNSFTTLQQGGVPVTMMGDQAAAALRGQGPAATELPPEVLQMIDGVRKQYGYDVTVKPSAQARLGVGQTPAQAAEAMIPAEVAKANALLAPEQQKAVAAQFAQKDTGMLEKAHTEAQSASQGNDMLQAIQKRVQSDPGVYGGMFAPGLQGTAAFINGLGIDFDAKRFQNTQESKKYMDTLGLSLIKNFVGSTNISNTDREAVMAIMPRINDDPKARQELMQTLQRLNDRKIATFEKMDSHLREHGSLKGFDYGMTKGGGKEAPDKPPTAGAKQAPDGNWYIKSGNKYYRVEQ